MSKLEEIKSDTIIEKDIYKYLKDIKTAIRKVSKSYFLWKDISDSDKEKMQERVFCYEFYHQFRKRMAHVKTSVAKRRQPNQRDGAYMIQKE